MRGSLLLDRGSARGAESQVRGSPEQHRSISFRLGIGFDFNRRERQDTGKRGEGGGEAGSKMLGAYCRNVLNENDKLLLGFAEDNKLALLNVFFAPLRVACPKYFKAPTATRDKHVWTIF